MGGGLVSTGTASKSKVSRVLPGGSGASARWRSRRRRPRSAISCSASAAKKRPAGQPSLSAWAASEGPDLLEGGQPQLGEEQLDTSGVAGIGGLHTVPTGWTVLNSS